MTHQGTERAEPMDIDFSPLFWAAGVLIVLALVVGLIVGAWLL